MEEKDMDVTSTSSPSDSTLESTSSEEITELEQTEQKAPGELPERGIWHERAELETKANAVELDVLPQRWDIKEEEEKEDNALTEVASQRSGE